MTKTPPTPKQIARVRAMQDRIDKALMKREIDKADREHEEHERIYQLHHTQIFAWERNEEGDRVWALQSVISRHRYNDHVRSSTKPDDPGWHTCLCGEWEGYWSGYNTHVAQDQLRMLTLAGVE